MEGGFKIPDKEAEQKKISDYVKEDNNFIEDSEIKPARSVEVESLADSLNDSKTKSNFLIYLFLFMISFGVMTTYLTIGARLTDANKSIDSLKQEVDMQATKAKPVASVTQSASPFIIKELGIQILVPASLSDLQYVNGESTAFSSGPNPAVLLTTKNIDKIDSKCSLSDLKNKLPSLGTIVKVDGNYTAASSNNGGQLLLQEKGYYIGFVAPSSNCSTNPKTLSVIYQARHDLFLNPSTITLIK